MQYQVNKHSRELDAALQILNDKNTFLFFIECESLHSCQGRI